MNLQLLKLFATIYKQASEPVHVLANILANPRYQDFLKSGLIAKLEEEVQSLNIIAKQSGDTRFPIFSDNSVNDVNSLKGAVRKWYLSVINQTPDVAENLSDVKSKWEGFVRDCLTDSFIMSYPADSKEYNMWYKLKHKINDTLSSV